MVMLVVGGKGAVVKLEVDVVELEVVVMVEELEGIENDDDASSSSIWLSVAT